MRSSPVTKGGALRDGAARLLRASGKTLVGQGKPFVLRSSVRSVSKHDRLSQWAARPAPFWVDDAFCLVCIVVAVLASRRPFPDPDLGWHLAGGLWMLHAGQIPHLDPFGVNHAFWLCYSWLPELIYAGAYRVGGFAAVHFLEICTFAGVAFFVVTYVRRLSRANGRDARELSHLSEWLTTVVLLMFLLPVCSLRPHVLSWVFLGLLILLTDAARLSVVGLLGLTLLWVNTHVYWILVPFVIGLTHVVAPAAPSPGSRARGVQLAAATLALGVVNPYGWRMFAGLYAMFFDQAVSNRLVFELAPLTVQHEAFPLFCAVLLGVALCGRRLIAREGAAPLVLCLVLAAAGARALKSLPLFAIAAAPLLVRGVFPDLLAWLGRLPSARAMPTWAPRRYAAGLRFAAVWVAVVLLGLLAIREVHQRPFLRTPQRELMTIAGQLERDERFRTRERVHVLSDANYGGWLDLALWLAQPATATESRFKVAIDNRGLVASEARFDEYDRLRQMRGDWRQIMERWQIDVAILPTQAEMIGALTADASDAALRSWDVLYASRVWTVLARRNSDPS
jgi:hypothetical protein